MNQTAKIFGQIAFASGIQCIPAHDHDLMEMTKGNKPGESIEILESWLDGWNEAFEIWKRNDKQRFS